VVLAERNRSTEAGFKDKLAQWLFADILVQQRQLIFDRSSLQSLVAQTASGNVIDSSVGIIELRASPARVVSDFLNRISALIIPLVLEIFLVGAALAYIFHRTLTKSLLKVADDLNKIDAHGSTMTQASVPSGHELDELGLVVSRTNDLLKEIFELHEAEALAKLELEDSERRYRSTFDNAAVGIVDLDRHHHIVRANSRMAEMLGHEVGSLVGLHIDSLIYDHDIEKDRGLLANLTAGEISTYVSNKRFIRKDAGLMYGGITASMVSEQDDPQRHLIMVVQDLTHNKEQEEKIEAQRAALIHREKIAALGSMLAGVAHELNNPLAIVMAQAELLAETAGDDKTRERAEKILKPAERCTRIVRTFLALARQREIKKTNINVKTLISDVCEVLDYQFKSNEIEVTVNVPSNIPTICGDSSQLSQVLMNLLVNSQQALIGTEVHRAVHVEVLRLNEHRIAIRVSDNGPGIPTSTRAQIFEPFFTTKPEGQGTGLGLSYCKSVTESHGGTVSVDEAATVGTAITIDLPIGLVKANSGNQPGQTIDRPGNSLRVLVVDDETELLDSIVEELILLGHEAVGYRNPALAVKAALTEDFDVIITDISMPVIDGPAFYEEICAKKPYLQDRFIFITGDSLNERANKFIGSTTAPCVYKPFKIADLNRVLNQTAKRSSDLYSVNRTADEPTAESINVGHTKLL
jgi:PAS domain S-box-containing protein